MIKINFIPETSMPQPSSKPAGSTSGVFRSTLNQAIQNQTTSNDGGCIIPSLGEISSPAYLNEPVSGSETALLSKTDNLLELLDQYSAKINDPHQTLKDIEPLLNAIRNQSDELVKESDSGLNDGSRLREIARRCALTATIECYKFNRGDYI